MALDHAPSYYAASSHPIAPFAPLDGDRQTDVCIIGGGYTGLSAALHLAETGVDVCLVEAEAVGWGASGRNGGQIGTGQRLWQTELEQMIGAEDARKLWDISEDAKALVLSLIDRHGIDCDLERGILNPVHKKRYEAVYHAYAAHLSQNYDYDGIKPLCADAMQALLKSPDYHGGLLDSGAAHLHPLSYARGIADAAREAGAAIHERTRATAIRPGAHNAIETTGGTIRAEHVIVASNGYLSGLLPKVENRLFPINNFVAATAPLSRDEETALIANRYAVADSRFVVYYFRFSGDGRLIFGGGETYSRHFPANIEAFVRPHLARIFPSLQDVRIDYAWGGTLAITMSRLPVFANPSAGIWAAGGYSGHGVAMATLGGQILAEAINGRTDRFEAMARAPTPAFPGGKLLRHPALAIAMLWYKLRDSF